MMQFFLNAGLKPNDFCTFVSERAKIQYKPRYMFEEGELRHERTKKKLPNCTLTPEVAEFLLTQGAIIDDKVLNYSVRHNQLLSFMLERTDLSLNAEHFRNLMLHHFADLKTLDMFSLHKVIAFMAWLQIQQVKDHSSTAEYFVINIIDLKNHTNFSYNIYSRHEIDVISEINTKFAQFQEYLGKYVYGVLLEADISQDIAHLISSYCVVPNATADLEPSMRLGVESGSLFLETLAAQFLRGSKASPISATEAQKLLLTMSPKVENSIKIELEEARLAYGANPSEAAATRVILAEHAEQALQESIQDLFSQGQVIEDGVAAAASEVVDPHPALLPGMDLWSSGVAHAQDLLGLDLREVE